MMKLQWISIVNSLSALLMLGSTSFAGVILNTPAPVASGPGLGLASVSLISTLSPNNDNAPVPNPNDNNITVPIKRFDNVGEIDLVFAVDPSQGVSEYKVSEFVDNNTGSPWTSYHMQLGFGTGANFQLSALNDGLDFDFPDYDTPPASAAFPFVATPDEDQLVFTGGIHAAGAQTYTFRIDVPDISGRAQPTFTLRQFPTAVPEPTTLALLGVVVLGGIATRRRS
ncbi:MAG TPA: PEP-CTERM sorting domain-containing protein [Lacipirellulaceae bacterium]|jgi:hypothetical protein|nr:PEP-CTERM sorting domain-containing protein [Lacipirellulaceae bacterium]